MDLITLEGVAANGKAGAILLTDTRQVWYIQGLSAWPEAYENAHLRVNGFPLIHHHDEAELRDESGAFRQDMSGDQRILSQASWVRLDCH